MAEPVATTYSTDLFTKWCNLRMLHQLRLGSHDYKQSISSYSNTRSAIVVTYPSSIMLKTLISTMSLYLFLSSTSLLASKNLNFPAILRGFATGALHPITKTATIFSTLFLLRTSLSPRCATFANLSPGRLVAASAFTFTAVSAMHGRNRDVPYLLGATMHPIVTRHTTALICKLKRMLCTSKT